MTEFSNNLPVQIPDFSHEPQHLTSELAPFKDTAGQWWMELELRKNDILQTAGEELGVDDEGNPLWENYDRTLSELRKAEDSVSSAIAEGFFKIACSSPYELRLVVSAQRVVAESCGFLPHQLKAPDADEDVLSISATIPPLSGSGQKPIVIMY